MAKLVDQKTNLEKSTRGNYFNLTMSNADGMAIFQDGVFRFANSALVSMSGYEQEELVGMPFLRLFTPECQRFITARHHDILAGKEVSPIYKAILLTKKGKVLDTEISVTLTKYEGHTDGSIIISDTAGCKQAEKTLRESEEKLERMFESVNDSIAVIDLRGNITDCNEAMVKMHGFSSKYKLVGKSAIELVAPYDRNRIIDNMRRAVKERTVRNVEYTFLKAGGTVFPGESSTSVLKDASGNLIGHITITRDISERKRAEKEIQRGYQLQTLLNRLLYLSVETGSLDELLQRAIDEVVSNSCITLELRAAAFLVERSPGVLVMKAQRNLSEALLKICDQVPFGRCLCGRGALSGKIEFADCVDERHENRHKGMHPHGHYCVPILSSDKLFGVITLYLKEGHRRDESEEEFLRAIANVMAGIIQRKQAEKKERHLQEELNITSRLASIGQMASGVAHEINNPLTSVIGFSQLLMRRDVPDDVKRDLEIVNSEAQRVARIVEGLLTFARQGESSREPVDINNIINKVLELRSYEMKVNNIQVTSQFTADLPKTLADSNQIQQVILNLVLNAEKEMIGAHGKGRLLIKTERANNSIRIHVTDDGPGISTEYLDKIFDPFFTTREVGNGTGLGLSICHAIVTRHKGRIYAKSEPGKGATLIVELPVVTDAGRIENTALIEEQPWQHIGAKVLVVDDEPTILDFLQYLLTEEGYEVETANSAQVALEKLRGEKYNLILLDVKLPVMSGIELYYHIETIDLALAQRTVFITGDVMEPATRDFLEKTKARHITKPINIESLKVEINHILAKDLELQRS
ncbi:PAS domain S-box protein [Chloroflexota bacterium]